MNENSEDKGLENEDLQEDFFDLSAISLPKMDNFLYSILNSLNQNIAEFYTLMKFTPYISEDKLNIELLKRSMIIHRDFTALFLHTKEEMVFTIYSESLEKIEKLLFKGEVGNNCISYTCKLCKLINDYKMALYREGYLQELKLNSLLVVLILAFYPFF